MTYTVKFNLYRLHFTSPLNLRDSREDANISQRTIHSDTLHAALISCLARTGQELPADGDLGCTVSDLFPYYQSEEDSVPVYFLPLPLQSRLPQLKDPADAKKVKKVRWVDAELYSRVLNGVSLLDKDAEGLRLVQGAYLTRSSLPQDTSGSFDFIKSEVVQRVKIENRAGEGDALPYYVDRVTFKHHSGLYFLAVGNTSLLEDALKLLALEGIGTDRNVGYGTFEYKTGLSLSLELPEDADYMVSLSMFIPQDKGQLQQLLSSEDVAYDFVRRGGWITSSHTTPYRKNAIYAFLPGSVFHGTGSGTEGAIVNLKPDVVDHPVWRSGRAIMLPLKLKE